MGCGKSKHDVVTGNTKTVRKPSEAESVKGKENETMKRQESCRCRKTNDISAAVSGDQTKTTVENNSKIQKAGEISESKEAGETNGASLVTAIAPENIVTEETVNNVNENPMLVNEQKEKVDIDKTVVEEKNDGDDANTEIPPPQVKEQKSDEQTPVTDLGVLETTTTENDDTEIPPPQVEEQKSDVQTPVTELGVPETTTTENDDTEIPPLEVEEPKSDVQAPVTELGLGETTTSENDENPATYNDETPVLKDEDKVNAVEENTSDITKEVESDA